MKTFHFTYLSLVLLVGCNHYDQKLLVGKWKAVLVEEEGRSLDVDLSTVGFEFFSNGTYQFTSTIDYREAGSYYLDGNLLYTTDTLNTASAEKAVGVAALSKDSLVLNMAVNERPKMMKLVKEND